MIIHLITGLVKVIYYKMSQYFPKPYKSFEGNINVKVDLSNYAAKSDIKNISHLDTSSFALKTNLASLKTEADILDIDKLVPVPVNLNKLSDAVKNDVVKKAVYDKLVEKVSNIDTSGFVLKTKFTSDKSELEKKNPDVSGFVEKATYNSKVNTLATKTALTAVENKIYDTSDLLKKQILTQKVTEIENKILDISSLAKKSALTAVENKTPDVSSLVRKQILTKITEIEKKLADHNHDEYITTPEFNTSAAGVFYLRLKQVNLVTKTDFDTTLRSLNQKINSNKTKHLLIKNELKAFDLSYFRGKIFFGNDVS